MIFRFLLLLLVILFSSPALAQDTCPSTIEELPFDISGHWRNRVERIDNLKQVMDTFTSGDLENSDDIYKAIYELMYWSAMAESAKDRFGAGLPDCGSWQMLDNTFDEIIDDVYAIAGQTTVLIQVRTDFQRENVQDILSKRLKNVAINIGIWEAVLAGGDG